MRNIVAAMLAIFLTVAWSTELAAQSAAWSHPRGLYSLDLSGWRTVRLAPDARELAVFAQGEAGSVSRLCLIHERLVPSMAERSQGDLNRFSETYAPSALANDAVSELRRLTVDGVVLSAFTRTNSERHTYASIRVFALSPSGTVTELSCRGTEPLTSGDRDEFERVLNSLRFQQVEVAQ
jgi:hypothetical protein